MISNHRCLHCFNIIIITDDRRNHLFALHQDVVNRQIFPPLRINSNPVTSSPLFDLKDNIQSCDSISHTLAYSLLSPLASRICSSIPLLIAASDEIACKGNKASHHDDILSTSLHHICNITMYWQDYAILDPTIQSSLYFHHTQESFCYLVCMSLMTKSQQCHNQT